MNAIYLQHRTWAHYFKYVIRLSNVYLLMLDTKGKLIAINKIINNESLTLKICFLTINIATICIEVPLLLHRNQFS